MEDRIKKEVLVEVPEKAKRRRFTDEYRRRILSEADNCSRRGELGEMLRREGLYSSQLADWRKQRSTGRLGKSKRGRKATTADKTTAEIKKLRRENKRLEERLRKAELIIDVQKKVSTLLGIPMEEQNEEK